MEELTEKTRYLEFVCMQDSRCTKDFLATLPKPDSHLNVHSGYGCATIFWMARNKPEKLEKFDRAATIQVCTAYFIVVII